VNYRLIKLNGVCNGWKLIQVLIVYLVHMIIKHFHLLFMVNRISKMFLSFFFLLWTISIFYHFYFLFMYLNRNKKTKRKKEIVCFCTKDIHLLGWWSNINTWEKKNYNQSRLLTSLDLCFFFFSLFFCLVLFLFFSSLFFFSYTNSKQQQNEWIWICLKYYFLLSLSLSFVLNMREGYVGVLIFFLVLINEYTFSCCWSSINIDKKKNIHFLFIIRYVSSLAWIAIIDTYV